MTARRVISCLLWCTALVYAQSPVSETDRPVMRGDAIRHDGAFTFGRGSVQIALGQIVIAGDEGIIDGDHDKISVRRHTTATVPARLDHNLIRSTVGTVLLTREAFVIAADEIWIANNLLQARGNVAVQQGTVLAQGDSAYLMLRIGDGELAGNVRQKDTSLRRPAGTIFRHLPPDLIK